MPKKTARQKAAIRNLERELDKLPRCGAALAGGQRCTNPSGFNTKHLGEGKCYRCSQPAGLATPIRVSPAQALAGVLHLAAGQLAYATMKVAELTEEDLVVEGIGLNPWIRLQRNLMHDVAKFAKISSDAGIDERMASLAEAQTRLMSKLLGEIADDLKLTPKQKGLLGPAIRRRLQLTQGSDGQK